MPVISCLNAKGGTGKTTSAINLAAVAAYRGYTVHVLDADAEQGTASEWIEYANDAFEEDPNAPHVDVEVEAVNRGILARKVKKYSDDLVIIDGPPSNHSMSELIIENSDFVLMLNQASGDREILAHRLGISQDQLSYITNSGEGEGLLYFGNVIVPFIDKFPKETKLYKLMTTKPGEKMY